MIAGAVAVTITSFSPLPAAAQPASTMKALVGGMLIDGNGGPPLHNSVILIEGERITAVGTIEPGKYADVTAVRGDVLRYVDLLQDVDLVIKHGVRYDRTTPSSAAPPVATATDTTVVLLVRHAERVSDAPNSDLSAAGLERAEHIAALAAETGVQAVYATDFCRAAQTAQPAAATLGLPIRVVATGNASAGLDACSPGIDVQRDVVEEPTPAGIAQRVLREQRGRTVLVVGHSNTVPAIAEALGATICPTLLQLDEQDRCWLADDRYGDAFVVRVPGDGGTVGVKLVSRPGSSLRTENAGAPAAQGATTKD